MGKPNIFFKLCKVDVAQRTVEGIATAELPDKTGEICDYDSTKPLYQKWSDGIKKASGGKSLGNVRAMHGNIAAGKVVDLMFDDVQKIIRIVAKIVDDAEWKKVVEGVYTGFSQGGEYISKWADGEFTRYTAEPSEVSIVDNPCLGEAVFEIIKSDGTKEMHKFTKPDVKQVWLAKDGSTHEKKEWATKKNMEIDAEAEAQALVAGAKKGLGDVSDKLNKREFSDEKRKELADKGHALPDGSFPIENEGDLDNAVQAVGRAKDPEKAKAHITQRAKDLKATDKLPAEWEGSTQKADGEEGGSDEGSKDEKTSEEAEKANRAKIKKIASMKKDETFDSSCALDALNAIEWLMEHEMMESEDGGDGEDDEADEQIDDLKTVVERLKSFIASEIMENTREDGSLEMSLIAGMTKSEHMDHVTAIHKAASNIMHRSMKIMGSAKEEGEGVSKGKSKDKDGGEKTDDAETHSNEEMQGHVEAIHKKAGDICQRCMKMGSEFKPEVVEDDADEPTDDDKEKGVKKLAMAMAKNSALTKAMGEVNALVSTLTKRIEHLESQPAARKGVLFTAERGHEVLKTGENEPVETAPVNMNALRLSPEEMRKYQGSI